MTLHIRNFTAAPQTVNLEAGTVEALIATGADVARGRVFERLDLAGVDLGRAAAGKLPVLDGHRAGSTRDVLGTVASVERRPEGLVATLRIDNAAVLERIRAGTLRNISIGYTVNEWRDLREGNRRIRVAAKWELLEVSIVPVPADPGAHFRTHGATGMENDIDVMTAPPPGDDVQTRAAVNVEIRGIATTAGLTRDWADAQIDRGATAEEARAAAFEAQILADLVNDNPAMADSVAVFHSDHGNTDSATSGGDTVEDFLTDIAAARLAMRGQTGLDGEIIDVSPWAVLVPPALETTAEKALAKIAATRAADANPFSALRLIVEPRLTSNSRWFVVADPARIDGLEYAHLAGAPGPQVETRIGWDVDGVEFKCRLDFGAGWLDWRGWQRVGS